MTADGCARCRRTAFGGFEQKAQWPKPKSPFRGNNDNAKTKLCMRCVYALSAILSCTRPSSECDDCSCRWENGHCRFGDRCNFAHGKQELRQLLPDRSSHFGSMTSYCGSRIGGAGPGQERLVSPCFVLYSTQGSCSVCHTNTNKIIFPVNIA